MPGQFALGKGSWVRLLSWPPPMRSLLREQKRIPSAGNRGHLERNPAGDPGDGKAAPEWNFLALPHPPPAALPTPAPAGAPPPRPYRGPGTSARLRQFQERWALRGGRGLSSPPDHHAGGEGAERSSSYTPHHGGQASPSPSRPPPPAPRVPTPAAALREGPPPHLEAHMKDTRGCVGLHPSHAGMLATGNLTASAGAREECGSVSVVFPITMLITGFVGNALAMLLVSRSYRRRESKRKKSFLLCIGWLALTDLVGQLLTAPVVIVVYLSKQPWEQLDPSGRLCTFFGLTMTVFGLSSLFIASAMAVERALAIRAPHWYASHMKTRATRAVLLGVWLAGLTFALLPVLGVGRYTVQWPGTWCFISTGGAANGTSSRDNWGSCFFTSTFAFLGLLALAITFACNLATIKALVSRCRAKATASQSSTQWGRITTETAIQLMGIMCVLSVCWSPLLIMMLKMIFNQTSVEHCKSLTEKHKECNFFLIAVRLASLNQILDPWVYLLLRKILLRKFCQVANAVSSCSNEGQKGQPISLSNEIIGTGA
ncbi:PREDICTED: prostaglandin E2 receptor EP3 subtype [Elephantulus edwardii]|uniref:prostaglandin E2 receptor EP3 subtype n=1 Tax=Elephantulus edwardii TaxID=28737 RepID=UPI0003F06DCF|nr:PREDICTED: prostaglandin E2 receptor EP3 subtype [Elephantulus edwardii]